MQRCDCPPYNCAGLVCVYLAGDRGAGDELARKFTPLVQAIVQRVLGPRRRGEWEDASQAVFLRVFARLDKWEGRCPFCKWLMVVASHRVIDLAGDADPTERLPMGEIVDPRPPPLTSATIECLERSIARFPPELRQVYYLTTQGIAHKEIAKTLGKSVRTIQYWLAEIRDRLLPCMEA